jgi:uncharacterized membrane protein
MTTDATSNSSPSQPGPLAVAAVGLACIAYFVTMHALIASGAWPMLSLGLVFLPWAGALGSALLGSDANPSTKALRRAAALVGLAVVGAIVRRFGTDLAAHAGLLLYLENIAFLLALAALFANSLRAGREALVTRLARIVRNGDMPPSELRYTRIVTIAWAGWFATLATISSVLFVTQSRTVWSAFVNLAILPLVAAAFVVEYAIRRRMLRELPHVPLMAGVHAFRHHAAIARSDAGSGPR